MSPTRGHLGTVNETDFALKSVTAEISGPTLLGAPRAVALLAFSELWERFSYFAILALLTLYLSADVANGGWGWQPHEAILFYGLYAGLAYALPVIGAWIANNHLGEQRCIMIGVWLFLLGHIFLASPTVVPTLTEWLTGVETFPTIIAAAIPQGQLWELSSVWIALGQTGVSAPEISAAFWVYVFGGGGFYFGLACLLFATGFFKSTVASLTTKFYPNADARRDAGLALLFTAVYLGAILANIIAGGLGESLGWSFGFGAAALGMSFAIASLVIKRKSWIGQVGTTPDLKLAQSSSGQTSPISAIERDRLKVLLLQSICTTVYAAAFFQKGGLLSVYTRDFVNRSAFENTVPVTWLMSISTIIFMMVTPTLAWFFLSLARRNSNPDAGRKLTAGLVCISAAYALLAFAESARVESSSLTIHIAWIIGCFVLFGIADALVWPTQLSLASKLAPKGRQAITIGVWHLTVAFGVWAGSLYGSLSRSVDVFLLFSGTATLCMLTVLLLTFSRKWMLKRLHGAERTDVVELTK